MPPSNGRKLQAPPCSTATIGPRAWIFLNRGIKFADVQRNKIDHRMAEMGQKAKFRGDQRMSALAWRSQPVDATLYLEREMECGLMVHRFHRGFTAAEKTEL